MNIECIESAITHLDSCILEDVLLERYKRLTRKHFGVPQKAACVAAASIILCSCGIGAVTVFLNNSHSVDPTQSNPVQSSTPPQYVPNFSAPSLEELYTTEPYASLLPQSMLPDLQLKSSYLTEYDEIANPEDKKYLSLVFESQNAQRYQEIKIREPYEYERLADPNDPSTYRLSLYYGPVENEGAVGGNLPPISGLFYAEDITQEITADRVYVFKDGLCKAEIDIICGDYVVCYGYTGVPISGADFYSMITSSNWFAKH